MATAMTLALAASGCGQPAPPGAGPVVVAPLRVTNNGVAFQNFEGAAARRIAEATCAGQGRSLRSGIYDRFEGGAWIFVEGCA